MMADIVAQVIGGYKACLPATCMELPFARIEFKELVEGKSRSKWSRSLGE